jgi:hypothetical protein
VFTVLLPTVVEARQDERPANEADVAAETAES